MGFFILIMMLWWSATSIASLFSVAEMNEYHPLMGLFLKIVYLPAGAGALLLPMYEFIWGDIAWWEVLLGVLAGLLGGVYSKYFFSTHPGMMLAANWIGGSASLIGSGMFIMFVF